MRNFSILYIVSVFFIQFSYIHHAKAQTLGLGQWDEMLPYRNALSVTASPNKIYCATLLSMYSIDKNDNSLERYTKINGLSDIETRVIAFDSIHNLLLICYQNSNIDIMQNGAVINISDIQRKSITGDKTIYSIFIYGDFAYLSCGFGIVVVDLLKHEIKDTYYIGSTGNSLQVNSVTSDGNYLYAATISGILRGALNDPNLANYSDWHSYTPAEGIHTGNYIDASFFNGNVYAAKGDSVFELNDLGWIPFFVRPGSSIKKLESNTNSLLICQTGGGKAQVSILHTTGLIDSIASPQPYQAISDRGIVWIADLYAGLEKFPSNFLETIYPDGPWTSNVFDMAVNSSNHNVYIASGGYNPSFGFTFNATGFFTRVDGTWNHYDAFNTPGFIDTFDIVCTAINPQNNLVYFGSWWRGIAEFDDQKGITNQFDMSNSTLEGTNGDLARVKVAGIAFDVQGNMWCSNLGALDPISVRKKDGTWLRFKPPFPLIQQWITQISFDQFGHVWFILPRLGVMVYDPGNSLDDPNDDQYRLITVGAGSGNLQTSNVNCIATDQDGNIWVGTNEGVSIFYCPGDVFSESGCEGQQIVITAEDGYNGYLLGTENVKKIVVDGANRKWFATDNGLWLFSADGTQQLQHFTADNSPLFINFIDALSIDNSTGDIYIGTEKGLMVYRGDATLNPSGSCSPTIFPNPVRENYSGPIAISGVSNNAEVRITDIAGNLIFRTKANGGQIIWNGNNYRGQRAESGVYLVLISNEDGSISCIGKLLMMR
ncbi:MAG: T9SS type A sorting domain-containing protein [Chitinophagales bacterium]|nr:T9SS type A sorting domain-containing protein [Chitinophagales bacterium]